MGFFSPSYGIRVKWGKKETEEQIGTAPKSKYKTFFDSESELISTLENRLKRMECKCCNSVQVSGDISLKVKEVVLCHEETKSGFFGVKIIKVQDKAVYSMMEDTGMKAKCHNCNHTFTTDGWEKMSIPEGIGLFNNYFGMMFNHFIPHD